jgi:hypothetical protein
MNPTLHDQKKLEPDLRAFYGGALDLLAAIPIPFLVGGAYALARYTGICRDTKDLDVFVRPDDCQAVLRAFAARGYRVDEPFPHWLAKVYHGEEVLDVIYSSGNALTTVDEEWFTHAVHGRVLDRDVLLCPVEEMIWSKSFILERERFDGADINHILRACASSLDWPRLLRRFGPDWRLLLAHLVLFGYVYPSETILIPEEVIDELLARLDQERRYPAATSRLCQGTLLSRSQYLIDIREWGYRDARLPPRGKMSPEEIAIWTAAIGMDNPALCQG